MNKKVVYIQKQRGSRGLRGSICKDCCFISIIYRNVNHVTPVLNHVRAFFTWFTLLQLLYVVQTGDFVVQNPCFVVQSWFIFLM